MRPLIIGPDEEAKIRALRALAEANVIPYSRMVRLHDAFTRGAVEPLRDMNSASTIRLPTGFQVTLTHEEHKPGVVCRHVSISVGPPTGKPLGPHPVAVDMLMKHFGFVNSLTSLLEKSHGLIWQEELEEGRFAINVMEPLDGDTERLRPAEETQNR